MDFGDVMTIAQAAERLRVPPQRVRALVTSGALPAERLGRMWLVRTEAVEQRRVVHDPVGRPFSQRLAWAVLAQLEGRPAAFPLAREERLRARNYARREPETIYRRLRGRHRIEELSVTSSARSELVEDPAWHKGGATAAALLRGQRDGATALDLYLPASRLEQLYDEHHAVPDRLDGNLRAHVVDDRYWCFANDATGLVWRSVIVLDELEHPTGESLAGAPWTAAGAVNADGTSHNRPDQHNIP